MLSLLAILGERRNEIIYTSDKDDEIVKHENFIKSPHK